MQNLLIKLGSRSIINTQLLHQNVLKTGFVKLVDCMPVYSIEQKKNVISDCTSSACIIWTG